MIDSWWPFGVLYSQHRELTYPPMTAVRHRISASDDDSIAADKLKQEVAAINSGYSVSLSVPRQSSPNMQPSNTVALARHPSAVRAGMVNICWISASILA